MKNEEFLREVFFRQAWEDAQDIFGTRAEAKFQRIAAVMFKPDALAGRRVRRALTFLAEHGFRPIAWTWIALDRMTINTVWRFQWNVATTDRLELSEQLYCRAESLLVYFEDDLPDAALPSTVRLLTIKGPGRVDLQEPHHLRAVIRTPNRTMSMIHAPDEPMDLLREMGILFDSRQRKAIMDRLAGPCPRDDTEELIAALRSREADLPYHDFDLESCIDRYRSIAGSDDPVRTLMKLREYGADAMKRGRCVRIWPALSDHLNHTAPGLDHWDRLLLGTSMIQHNEPNAVCAIDSDGIAEWNSGLGHMLHSGENEEKQPLSTQSC